MKPIQIKIYLQCVRKIRTKNLKKMGKQLNTNLKHARKMKQKR